MLQQNTSFGVPRVFAGLNTAPFGNQFPLGKSSPFATVPGSVPLGAVPIPGAAGCAVPPVGTTGFPITKGVPNVGLGALPNVGLGALPNVGLGALPNVGLGALPNVGLGALPNVGLGALPNVGLGALPNVGLGALPNVGLGAVPNVGLGAIPPTGLGLGALPNAGLGGPSVCFPAGTGTTSTNPLANPLALLALSGLLNQPQVKVCTPTFTTADGGISGTKTFCNGCN